jgi:hypothetical protein
MLNCLAAAFALPLLSATALAEGPGHIGWHRSIAASAPPPEREWW